MKQLLFLAFLLPFTCFSQSIDLGNVEEIKSSSVDEKRKEFYVFYQDSISVFDLTRWIKISNFDTKPPSNTFYDDYYPVSVNSQIHFVENLGGKVYKLKGKEFERIDNSFSHRMQIKSTIFTHNDTIFRYGGYGFWSLRNFFTFFKKSNKEWEIVPPLGSETFPSGSMSSTVKTIDENFYVYGGTILNESNPNERKIHDEVWRFSRGNNSWEFIGNTDFEPLKYNVDISYGKDHIFMDMQMDMQKDEIYLVDVQKNLLKTFPKKLIHRRIIPKYRSFFMDNTFYLFIYKSTSGREIQLLPIGEDHFFGKLIASDSFYNNNEWIFYLLSFLLLALIAVTAFVQVKKLKIRRKRILVEKDKISFKGKSLGFDEKSIRVINLLLRSDEEVQYKDILEITENKNLNYAHNTKVMNTKLDEINFKLKSVLNIDEDVITFQKSDLDKRVKIFSIDESYFLVK